MLNYEILFHLCFNNNNNGKIVKYHLIIVPKQIKSKIFFGEIPSIQNSVLSNKKAKKTSIYVWDYTNTYMI